jgi:2-keto-4-pentenoate hydratase
VPDQQLAAELAGQLWAAGQARVPIEPLTDRHPGLKASDGYDIQSRNIERRVAAGAHIRGRKIGLTSRVMQELLGVTEPDYGVLLDDMFVEDGDEIPLETMVQPRVEAEMAFVLGQELAGPGVTTANALTAIAGVLPAIEVVDSRVAGWRIRLADTVATTPPQGKSSSAAGSPRSLTSTRGWWAWC